MQHNFKLNDLVIISNSDMMGEVDGCIKELRKFFVKVQVIHPITGKAGITSVFYKDLRRATIKNWSSDMNKLTELS
jgi:hypothetical protein